MSFLIILALLQDPGAIYRVGNGVTPPSVLSRVSPAYSDAAREAKVQGTVVLQAVISEEGIPMVTQVVRSLGYGLDETAVSALEKWRFRPGMKDGKPVKVSLNVEVNFNLGAGPATNPAGPSLSASHAAVIVAAVDPSSSSTIYAGTKTGLYKTVDGGDTWVRLGTFENITALAVNPQNPSVIYAGSGSLGMFKSMDKGQAWKTLEQPATRAILIDPRSSTTLYAATIRGVRKSVDGGDTWTEVLPFSSFSKLAIDPAAPNSILAVTDAGELFSSADAGAHWRFAGGALKEPGPAVPSTGSRAASGPTVTFSAGDPVDSLLAAPKLISPVEGGVFDTVPRQMTLRWSASPMAASYVVEWDYSYNGVWHLEDQKMADFGWPVQGLEFTFDFIGAQPGRWRVWPVNAAGQRGTPSEWRTFRFTR